MATLEQIRDLLDRQARIQQEMNELLITIAPGNGAALQAGATLYSNVTQGLQLAQSETTAAPPDGGDAARLGVGADTASSLGGVFFPRDVRAYDDELPSSRLIAVADLYYCYQHERLGVFRAVQKLQELFRAGSLRLEDGPGAFGLYRFDRKSVLRYTRTQRMQAYKRVFGYTDAAPPPGARPNDAFHGLLQRFATELAQLFRDKRVAEVVRGPAATPDATFGSVAATRRAGLDFRANLKHAAYGDVSVLTVELLQLLRTAFEILGSQDVLRQFGADNAWDSLEEVLRRYFNEEPQASQRSRMGVAGRAIISWLAQPFVLATSRAQFEANALSISEEAEEWLTSARSLGLLTPTSVSRITANVVPLRRAVGP
jgi:hypothetical protein